MRRLAIACVVVLGLLSAVVVSGLWASGYHIRLVPFGRFSPFAELALFGALMLFALASLILVVVARLPRLRRAILVVAILAMTWLPWAAPWRLMGFESRILGTRDEAWLKLADDARSLMRASTPDGQLPRHPGVHWNRQYVARLAEAHPVLRLGDFPPKLFVGEDSFGVYWGSGLIGTLAVDISSSARSDPPAPDGYFGRKRVTGHVTLVWE